MKHLHKFSFVLFVVLLFTQTSFAFVNPVVSTVAAGEVTTEPSAKPAPFSAMTVKYFLTLTPKKYTELTGKKLTFPQKVSLKLVQLKIKNQLRKGKLSESSPVDFHDPVQKWMWFWIFGWGIGLVLLFVPVLWVLSSLFFLFGTISLIVWLVKKAS